MGLAGSRVQPVPRNLAAEFPGSYGSRTYIEPRLFFGTFEGPETKIQAAWGCDSFLRGCHVLVLVLKGCKTELTNSRVSQFGHNSIVAMAFFHSTQEIPNRSMWQEKHVCK